MLTDFNGLAVRLLAFSHTIHTRKKTHRIVVWLNMVSLIFLLLLLTLYKCKEMCRNKGKLINIVLIIV